MLLAGSITESGASFLLDGRLIDVETGVVIGAQSVSVPKEELIVEAEAFKYEYVTWTEFQYGEFDPASADYGNSPWVTAYYGIGGLTDGSLPTYAVEYSQKYLDALLYYVWQPVTGLTFSFGVGGLIGMYSNYIKIGNVPIYIGSIVGGLPWPAEFNDENYWLRKTFVTSEPKPTAIPLAGWRWPRTNPFICSAAGFRESHPTGMIWTSAFIR